jgi:hypothetical protein
LATLDPKEGPIMRAHPLPIVFGLVLAAAISVVPAQGYGSRYGGSDEQGFFLFLDAALAQPSDTDMVVGEFVTAAGATQTSGRVAPDWGAGLSARVGGGYRWATGGALSVSFWGYDDDESFAADGPAGGFLNFAIGPATYYDGYPVFNFGIPGSAAFKAKIEASTIDVAFSQTQELSDILSMEWSVGLRYASYEDGVTGTYDLCASTGCDAGYGYAPGEVAFAAERTTKSDMFGVRAGVRGKYSISERVAVRSGLALSLLTGDTNSRSGLTPTGTLNALFDSPTSLVADESNRSGRIIDLDVGMEFDLVQDLLRMSLAYEHSVWDGVPRDLARNPPGVLTVLDPRDQVTFSGVRLGLWVRF